MTLGELNTKERQALLLAADLLLEHGLADWHLKLKKVRTYHAQTNYRHKMITWNVDSIRAATKDEFMGIMYHEIAHALVGPGNGHNGIFKAKYYELSGDMVHARYKSVFTHKAYTATCNSCGHVSQTNDRKLSYCRRCWAEGARIVSMTVVENPMTLVGWQE